MAQTYPRRKVRLLDDNTLTAPRASGERQGEAEGEAEGEAGGERQGQWSEPQK
jgi:hypothetical protein